MDIGVLIIVIMLSYLQNN